MNNEKIINYKIGKLTADELKQIGCFISYRHDDKCILNEIADYCKDINILSDELIESGCVDFNLKIKMMIAKSICGVIVYNGGITPWMMYEIGLLKAMNKKIYVYSKLNLPIFLSTYQRIEDLEELHKTIKHNLLFNDIFTQESNLVKKVDFDNKVLQKLRYVSLNISIAGLSEFSNDSYRFSFIVPGLFKIEKETKRENICYKNKEPLEDAFCKCYNTHKNCPLINTTLKKGSVETVILNKIYDAIDTSGDVVKYILPVSIEYGLTFKCFIDILDFSIKDKLIKTLSKSGLISLEESWSAATDRMYFLLPKRVQSNLFVIENSGGFCDNYLCPGAVL